MIKLNPLFINIKNHFIMKEPINYLDRVLFIPCQNAFPTLETITESDIPIYKNYYGAIIYYIEKEYKTQLLHENPTELLKKNIEDLTKNRINPGYFDFLK